MPHCGHAVYPLCIPLFSPPSPIPFEDQQMLCHRSVLICQFSPGGKIPQLGAMLPTATCWNIWIHESYLLTEECTVIRVILVWSMLHCWGIMHTEAEYCYWHTYILDVRRLQSSHIIRNGYSTERTCLAIKNKRQKKGRCEWMHNNQQRSVCISIRWLIRCVHVCKGRRRKRSNETVANRPVGISLGEA